MPVPISRHASGDVSDRPPSLDLRSLGVAYQSAQCDPAQLAAELLGRARASGDNPIWIHLLSEDEVAAQVAQARRQQQQGVAQPLFGVPFAVKDNIDVAGQMTTAGCPAFAYRAQRSATAVSRLCGAGAILIGKTNLDQFATGLSGTRSPYGVCRNLFDPRYISGGSSSGSALAVAAGLVSFALGTDTAGSGRVPAAFGNIIGFKPTRGTVSAAGVVPACRSLDCVSVLALTCEDAAEVWRVLRAFDPADPYARRESELPRSHPIRCDAFRFGVPKDADLRFFENGEAESLYRQAVRRLASLGGTPVEIDFSPFATTASLLYEGPWCAERLAAIESFFNSRPESLLPVTRDIIGGAASRSAVDAFKSMYQVQSLRRQAQAVWDVVDLLLLPTAGTIYSIAQMQNDPVALNTNLGYYTNFVNLMDLCGVAIPAGFQLDGLPFGVSLLAPAGHDAELLEIGDAAHRSAGVGLGATGHPLHPVSNFARDLIHGRVEIAVVGAHLSGQPLNSQLTDRGGALVRACRTEARYRLFALPGTIPPKPGLIRCIERQEGVAIEVEVWELSEESFGSFVAAVPSPLVIGTITLEDGKSVKSFLCESHGIQGARDISEFGGWRGFLASR